MHAYVSSWILSEEDWEFASEQGEELMGSTLALHSRGPEFDPQHLRKYQHHHPIVTLFKPRQADAWSYSTHKCRCRGMVGKQIHRLKALTYTQL